MTSLLMERPFQVVKKDKFSEQNLFLIKDSEVIKNFKTAKCYKSMHCCLGNFSGGLFYSRVVGPTSYYNSVARKR